MKNDDRSRHLRRGIVSLANLRVVLSFGVFCVFFVVNTSLFTFNYRTKAPVTNKPDNNLLITDHPIDDKTHSPVPTVRAVRSPAKDRIVFDGHKFVFSTNSTTSPDHDGVKPPLCDKGHEVTIVGNRPVGTYLCDYLPTAERIPEGCRLTCPNPRALVDGGAAIEAVRCTVKRMGSYVELTTADAVVNHHGPVPRRNFPAQMTVYYSGESNASLPKRSTGEYWRSYTHVVSFHSDNPLHFTWVHRFLTYFNEIAASGSVPLLPGDRRLPVKPWEQRIAGIATFVSRCKRRGRERLIANLAQGYPVFSFGKCARTHTVAQAHPECSDPSSRYREKLCVYRQYKYVLALENTQERDYVTEKVFHGLITGAVPLYDGAPNTKHYIPTPTSVIFLADFAASTSADQQSLWTNIDYDRLSKHLRTVTSPDHLGWMGVPSSWGAEFLRHLYHPDPSCDLCRLAAQRKCNLS